MATMVSSNSSIEWGPVIAGTVLACAVSIVLTQFGHSLGLSFDQVDYRTLTPERMMIFGLWLLWTQLSASIMGAYLAGRAISAGDIDHEGEMRDGMHGLLVWALSTVLAALFVTAAAMFATEHAEEVRNRVSQDTMHKFNIIAGFSLAAISILSAVTAWIVASIAGDHRDRKVDVVRYITFRRVTKRAR